MPFDRERTETGTSAPTGLQQVLSSRNMAVNTASGATADGIKHGNAVGIPMLLKVEHTP
jgi:hypothetical protein